MRRSARARALDYARRQGVTVEGETAVLRRFDAAVDGLIEDARAAAEEIGTLLEEDAKRNHPWKNRTGETEATTQSAIEEIAGQIFVHLLSGTPQAVFLELARQGKWAWLLPTMERNLGAMEEILRRHMTLKGPIQ